ncbi:MAG: glutamate--tRNA ligase [Polyangiaceae bacterium]|nr:glutamate--tRNA ligase [Polyangiaceae bacterium]
MEKPRLRFAPSPTGYLHIGGVRTALFNWLWARHTGGAFVLRIEDTDQERSTPESKQVILDSLRWLGIDWDEGPEVGGEHGPYEQMQRLSLYAEWAERLIAEKKAYRCYCTKAELDAQREALKKADPKAQFKYPGTCRNRTDKPDLPSVVRFMTDTAGEVVYVDKVFGEVRTPNKELQDFVLVRGDGVPLYNFGAVVDDITMGIGIVARGRDHMINTPPQILIYQAFGAKVPEFAHLPMMLNQAGAKLSKRDGAVGVFEYRDLGYTPGAVLNYLVRFGWSHGDQEVFSKQQLVDVFNWEACGRGDGKFDPKKFASIQHEHLKSKGLTPDDEYVTRVLPFLAARGLANVDRAMVERALYTIRERATTLVDAAEKLDYYFRDEPVMDEKAAAKFLVKEHAENLRAFRDVSADGEWTEAALEARAVAFLAAKSLEMKHIAQPARVALTGRTASPSLYQVMFVLGRDASLARLDRAVARAEKAG